MVAHGLGALAKVLPATLSRRRALGRLGAVMAVPPIAALRMPARTAAQAAGTEIGRASAGQTAFQLVGTIEQRGFDFVAYGFLMEVAGLDPAHLFTDDDAFNRSAQTARLTFRAEATATARTIHHPLFMVVATGTMTFFVNQTGGATFDEPESFGAGTDVAGSSLTVQNVINVHAPQQGIMSGFAHLVQERGDPFSLDDTEYAFGAAGLETRVSLAGQGTLLDPELPEAAIRFVGNAVALT